VRVRVAGDLVRLSREAMAPFWAVFGHAVRNAVAHGIESVEERAAAGKSGAGEIALAARHDGAYVVIEVADDGRGIDWTALRARAQAAGLPYETPEELHDALFHDGLSTRDTADDVAGRGIGMGALRAECERLGGRMSVDSAQGAGTRVRFAFPAEAVAENDETRRARFIGIRPSGMDRVRAAHA
jgi:chemotaxis protein histidine kinase CheA